MVRHGEVLVDRAKVSFPCHIAYVIAALDGVGAVHGADFEVSNRHEFGDGVGGNGINLPPDPRYGLTSTLPFPSASYSSYILFPPLGSRFPPLPECDGGLKVEDRREAVGVGERRREEDGETPRDLFMVCKQERHACGGDQGFQAANDQGRRAPLAFGDAGRFARGPSMGHGGGGIGKSDPAE